jgi:hypothetical protein
MLLFKIKFAILQLALKKLKWQHLTSTIEFQILNFHRDILHLRQQLHSSPDPLLMNECPPFIS